MGRTVHANHSMHGASKKTLGSFSATNASHSEAKIAYVKLNSQTPCPPRVALSRLAKGMVGGFFTLNTRIAFGNGCDCPSYVGGPCKAMRRWPQLILLLFAALAFGYAPERMPLLQLVGARCPREQAHFGEEMSHPAPRGGLRSRGVGTGGKSEAAGCLRPHTGTGRGLRQGDWW